jgi:hypothetical protein
VPGIILPSNKGAGGYSALVGPGSQYAGVDQGVDWTGAFDVYAPANAVVTRVMRGGSGWPGEGAVLNLKLLNGPKAGSYIYVAEDFAPRADLKPGTIVQKGATIGRATGSGKAPGIEVGWAQPSGIPLAPRPPARPANQYTSQGEDFRQFVTGADTSGGGYSVGDAAHDVNSGLRHVPGVAQVEGAVGAVTSVGDFLGKLTDPSYILRGLQVIAGAVLVLVGVVLLTRQVALAADLPDPAGLADKVPAVVPVPV